MDILISLWLVQGQLLKYRFTIMLGWPNEYSAHVHFWEIGESEDSRFESRAWRFEPYSSQTNDFKIDTYRFLARCSALLG